MTMMKYHVPVILRGIHGVLYGFEGCGMNFDNDILIVDDEISNLRLLAEMLEKNGYTVRPAETVKMAIDSALAKPPGEFLTSGRSDGPGWLLHADYFPVSPW
jgi:hypothetical protein